MLLLALVAVVMPAIFELVRGHGLPGVGDLRVDYGHKVELLSALAVASAAPSYAGGLLFSLRTHRELFNPIRRGRTRSARGPCGARW